MCEPSRIRTITRHRSDKEQSMGRSGSACFADVSELIEIFACGIAVVLATSFACGSSALAQETPATVPTSPAYADKGILPIPDYSGDIGHRAYLTGDWGGLRDQL